MSEIGRSIWAGLIGASVLDQVNLALGLAGVVLMIRRSLWAFPVGLVAVSVQGVLFYRTKFYADATQQVFFFAALAWGWWHWVRDRGAAPELPVTALSWRARAAVLLGGCAAVAIWALALQRWTDAVMPWRDAFIAVFGIVAQWLQARKAIDNWPLWIVVNAVAIAAYWEATLAYTALLYAIYLGLAVVGWRAWAKAKAGDAAPSPRLSSERGEGAASPVESQP
ncbi:MAG: nicotinamide mononucleotide transporter [Opitutaceae bacterium]|nr:nicotinamide mononucleotide transporter [Opitutaceae bacterium]